MVHAREPKHRIDVTFKPRKVVYAIAPGLGKVLTADTLFTFSQVALYRAVRRLRGGDPRLTRPSTARRRSLR
jgi:uncharacterized protein (TIGR04141 family)